MVSPTATSRCSRRRLYRLPPTSMDSSRRYAVSSAPLKSNPQHKSIAECCAWCIQARQYRHQVSFGPNSPSGRRIRQSRDVENRAWITIVIARVGKTAPEQKSTQFHASDWPYTYTSPINAARIRDLLASDHGSNVRYDFTSDEPSESVAERCADLTPPQRRNRHRSSPGAWCTRSARDSSWGYAVSSAGVTSCCGSVVVAFSPRERARTSRPR